jgi:hypothetical protein
MEYPGKKHEFINQNTSALKNIPARDWAKFL